MKKCPKCNSIAAEGQAFCTFCGETFIAEKQQKIGEGTPVQTDQPGQNIYPETPVSPAQGDLTAPPAQPVQPVQAEQPAPPGPTRMCPKCHANVPGDQAFCTNCGEPLQEGKTRREIPRSSSSSPLGSLVDEQHRKHIRGSRIAIMFVAVVTIIFSIIAWINLENEIARINRDPTMVVLEDVVAQNRLIIGATFVIGLVFVGLFFWAKKNPFSACLTALIIYLTNIIVALGIDPSSLVRGIIVKIIIIAALANGVKSGLAFRKLKENPEQTPL